MTRPDLAEPCCLSPAVAGGPDGTARELGRSLRAGQLVPLARRGAFWPRRMWAGSC